VATYGLGQCSPGDGFGNFKVNMAGLGSFSATASARYYMSTIKHLALLLGFARSHKASTIPAFRDIGRSCGIGLEFVKE